MDNPIYVALDTPELAHATALAKSLAPYVGGFKLGLEFFMAQGPAGVRAMGALGRPIFLDVKLHDIPNTVAGAIRSLAGLDMAIVNVHAAGGRAMMEAARAAAPASCKVIAVTVLTSLEATDLADCGVSDGPAAQVARLADLTRAAGLDGIVCSAHEVAARRAAWPQGLFVVPGIRPAGAEMGDQKRIMRPKEALAAGAGILVIGRPITAAADPARAAADILDQLA